MADSLAHPPPCLLPKGTFTLLDDCGHKRFLAMFCIEACKLIYCGYYKALIVLSLSKWWAQVVGGSKSR